MSVQDKIYTHIYHKIVITHSSNTIWPGHLSDHWDLYRSINNRSDQMSHCYFMLYTNTQHTLTQCMHTHTHTTYTHTRHAHIHTQHTHTYAHTTHTHTHTHTHTLTHTHAHTHTLTMYYSTKGYSIEAIWLQLFFIFVISIRNDPLNAVATETMTTMLP